MDGQKRKRREPFTLERVDRDFQADTFVNKVADKICEAIDAERMKNGLPPMRPNRPR